MIHRARRGVGSIGPGSISLVESIFLLAGNEVSLTGNIEYPLKRDTNTYPMVVHYSYDL